MIVRSKKQFQNFKVKRIVEGTKCGQCGASNGKTYGPCPNGVENGHVSCTCCPDCQEECEMGR